MYLSINELMLHIEFLENELRILCINNLIGYGYCIKFYEKNKFEQVLDFYQFNF